MTQTFQEWLSDPRWERVVTVEMTMWDLQSNGLVTEYFSTRPFATSSTDPTPIGFNPAIVSISPLIQDATDPGVRIAPAIQEMVLDNSDGQFDSWVDARYVDTRAVVIKMGQPDWPYSQFGTVFTGVGDRLIYSDRGTTVTVTFRSKLQLLDKTIQETLIADGPEKDKPMPILLGLISNGAPVLEDEANLVYRMNDGVRPLESVTAVRDNGVLLAEGANYTKNLTAGTLTLLSVPRGQITFDARTPRRKIFDFLEDLILDYSDLTSADIDRASWDARDAEFTQVRGYYIDREANLMDVVDELLKSVDCTLVENAEGKIEAVKLVSPGEAGTITGYIGSSLSFDFGGLRILDEIEVTSDERSVWKVTMNYDKTWHVQDEDSLSGLVLEDQTLTKKLTSEWRSVVLTDAGTKTVAPLARTLTIDSFLSVSTTATTVGQNILNRYKGGNKRFYELTVDGGGFFFKLGSLLSLAHDRYGLADSKGVVVRRIEKDLMGVTTKLKLWR